MKLAVAPAVSCNRDRLDAAAAAAGRGAGQRGRARVASRGLRPQAGPIARQAADERGPRAHPVRFLRQPCEGYALQFRQVSQLDSGEGKVSLSDLRATTWEEGGGASGCASTRRTFSTTGCATRSTARPSGAKSGIGIKLTKPADKSLDYSRRPACSRPSTCAASSPPRARARPSTRRWSMTARRAARSSTTRSP